MYDLSCFKDQRDVKFHQFVVEEYPYLSKKGEMKSGKGIIRKDFNEAIQEFINICDGKQSAYLLYQFEIKNDLLHGPQILSDTDVGYLFHQDYSENISCTRKYGTQEVYFSSKQLSLHCTVVYGSERESKYAYINDKGHDSAFTLLVTKDLMEQFDNAKRFCLLYIKSDNCSVHIVVCMSLKPTYRFQN